MKTFISTGPLEGHTGMIASWMFTDGRLELPDDDADAASRILCRFHGCKILETGDMIVAIWGPKRDGAWRTRAQQVARERWPGRALQVRHPSQWKPLSKEEAARIDGVLVTEGCEQVVDGCYAGGIRPIQVVTIPLNPGVPDPGRSASETQGKSRTGTYLADPNDDDPTNPEDPPVTDPGPGAPGEVLAPAGVPATDPDADERATKTAVAERFIEKDLEEIVGLLKDGDMATVLTDELLEEALKIELASGEPRGEVVEVLSLRVGKPVDAVVEAATGAVATDETADNVPDEAQVEAQVQDGDQSPDAAEPPDDSGKVTPATVSPETFVRMSVRAVRDALGSDEYRPILTADFLRDAIEAEQEKARPREDTLRKLRMRMHREQSNQKTSP